MNKLDNQKFIMSRFDNYIESSQNKSNLYLALNTLVLGGVITLVSTLNISEINQWLLALMCLISLLSVIGILITLSVINPYLKSSTKKKSLFFFKDVAEESSEDYLATILEISEGKLAEDIANQNHGLANALKGKYIKLCTVGWIVAIEFVLLFIWVTIFIISNT